MNQTSNQELITKYLKDLSDEGTFEIWSPPAAENNNNIYIPYMMNDAMECYIILKNATLVGVFNRDMMADTTASIENGDGSQQLMVISQKDSTDNSISNVCTVWFSDVSITRNLYRFDQICHYWKPGYEQWSQLTYIIGTMYDKYLWAGAAVCNKTELSLMKLIEFAPFRAYAPAPELFEELYDNTMEGLLVMKELAKSAHDYSYVALCSLYGVFPTQFLGRLLCSRLISTRRFPLYELIYKNAIAGSCSYPDRHYLNVEDNELINSSRLNADLLMKKYAFSGQYPDYHKDNLYVRITEEQPFTIMDWDEITFSQKWMVSVCNKKMRGMNLGFFKGSGLHGFILDRDEFIQFLENPYTPHCY